MTHEERIRKTMRGFVFHPDTLYVVRDLEGRPVAHFASYNREVMGWDDGLPPLFGPGVLYGIAHSFLVKQLESRSYVVEPFEEKTYVAVD